MVIDNASINRGTLFEIKVGEERNIFYSKQSAALNGDVFLPQGLHANVCMGVFFKETQMIKRYIEYQNMIEKFKGFFGVLIFFKPIKFYIQYSQKLIDIIRF